MRAGRNHAMEISLVCLFLAEHGGQEVSPHFFHAINGLLNRGLVFKGQVTLEVAKSFGHFAERNFGVLDFSPGTDGGIAGLAASTSLRPPPLNCLPRRCRPHRTYSPLPPVCGRFGGKGPSGPGGEPPPPGRSIAGGSPRVPANPAGANSTANNRMDMRRRIMRYFLGWIVIRRWRACHSWSGNCPVALSRKRR